MKRGTVEHPKTAALASMLGVKRHVAVGLLEMLWHHTARYAPRGDIGKWKDCQIAAALDWPNDDSGRLIQCLVDSGWIDLSPEHRLLIHDWHEHSDGTCDKYLADNGMIYATSHDPRRLNSRSRKRSDDKSSQVTTSDVTRARAQNQNQNQNQNQEQSVGDAPAGLSSIVGPELQAVLNHAVVIGMDAETAQKFWNHYNALGWMKGKTKIAHWQSLLANWKIEDQERQAIQKKNGGGGAGGSGAGEQPRGEQGAVVMFTGVER